MILNYIKGCTADNLTIDRLSALTQIAVSELSDLLFDLEELHAVRRLPGNRYATDTRL